MSSHYEKLSIKIFYKYNIFNFILYSQIYLNYTVPVMKGSTGFSDVRRTQVCGDGSPRRGGCNLLIFQDGTQQFCSNIPEVLKGQVFIPFVSQSRLSFSFYRLYVYIPFSYSCTYTYFLPSRETSPSPPCSPALCVPQRKQTLQNKKFDPLLITNINKR